MMVEIPGARAELDNAFRILDANMRALARALEPDQQPEPDLPPEPAVLDRREPLRHAYQLTLSLVAMKQPCADHAVHRGGLLLAEAGWSVETDPGPTGNRAVARRDGFVITVVSCHGEHAVCRVGEGYAITGETPHVLLHEPVEFVPPEPCVTAGTLPAGALLCYECDGLGWCPCCLGRGFLLDDDRRRRRCTCCFTQRVCLICEGAGLKWVHTLSGWAREQYPELRQDRPEGGG
ncbi:hypothetical protein AWW66_17730 [Micromonospora rosaria]|uniref:Uncharacterized protein n=1 Tax=Micromonospora rosaria TaxID=47874 RepID=A0A136PQA7_9ACTN|nr:hypothetical protein [Micromonospora rosaria]KXK60655.1 hypothetical protein AWW66_17730 [Micromonospora rosaria]